MADRKTMLTEMIRTASGAVEPITLDELRTRSTDRFEYQPDLVLLDRVEPSVNGSSPDPMSIARSGRAFDRRRKRLAWIGVAAVAAIGALLTIAVLMAGDGGGGRISTKPAETPKTTVDPAPTTADNQEPDQDRTADQSGEEASPTEPTNLATGIDVTSLLPLDDGRLAVGGHANRLQIWDPDAPDDGPSGIGLELPSFPGIEFSADDRRVTGLTQVTSGAVVVASSFDEVLTVDEYDIQGGFAIRGGLHQNAPAPSALLQLDDRRLATGTSDGQVIIETVGDDRVVVNTAHIGPVLAVGQLPDGRIVSGGGDTIVRIWDPTTGLEDPTVPPFTEHSAPVTAIAVFRDGRVAAGSAAGVVLVWHPDDPTVPVEMFDGHSDAVTALVVLPDNRLASGSADTTVQIWDPDEPSVAPTVMSIHTDTVTALVVLDGGLLASGSADTTVQIWPHGSIANPASDGSDRTADPAGSAEPQADSTTGVDTDGPVPLVNLDIPRYSVDQPPVVVECEGGGPGLPPNEGQTGVPPRLFDSAEGALLDFVQSGGTGGEPHPGESLDFARFDTPDGSIHYAALLDQSLPAESRELDEALLLITVVPAGDQSGFHVTSWEQTGC